MTTKHSVGYAIAAALPLLFGMPVAAGDDHNKEKHEADLSGYQEVPTLSSGGTASFRARIADDEQSFDWVLTYSGLTNVLQSHIHFAARAINGGIVIFLCTNLGNAPPGTTSGTQPCPSSEGTVSGTATAADVGPGAAAQGIAAGEFAKVLQAIRVGAAYANIHTQQRPAGEVRGQIHSHEHSD
jgi:CHRD domain-containing protein